MTKYLNLSGRSGIGDFNINDPNMDGHPDSVNVTFKKSGKSYDYGVGQYGEGFVEDMARYLKHGEFANRYLNGMRSGSWNSSVPAAAKVLPRGVMVSDIERLTSMLNVRAQKSRDRAKMLNQLRNGGYYGR